MIVIGGLTRLTESGLSIVEWKLVSGILPPFTEAAWQKEFTAYQTSPQYQKINTLMTVAEFKQIFWLEYLHRLLGRMIGLVAVMPLLFLSVIPAKAETMHRDWLLPRMWLIALLIGIQGVVGWYMVKSGLIDVPWVSPYRLALHLGLAMIILGLLMVTLLRLNEAPHPDFSVPAWMANTATFACLLIFVQILFGAFVAGLDAGLTYNSFPKMDGDWIPQGLWLIEPHWRNVFENVTMVNFLHRWWAFVVAAGIFIQSFLTLRLPLNVHAKTVLLMPAALVAVQIALGIATLLQRVPTGLAVTHQAVAALLFITNVVVAYLMHRRRETSPSQNNVIP